MEKTGETLGLGTHHRRGAGAGPVPGPPGAAHNLKSAATRRAATSWNRVLCRGKRL